MSTITDWTSGGMQWPPPVDANLWLYLEAIRLALAERATVVGYTLPTRLQAPLVQDSAARLALLDIETVLNAMRASFADYLDHGGNWTGAAVGSGNAMAATAVPVYTGTTFNAAVLAASGVARLSMPPVNSGRAVREWVAQQRHCVEALRWTRHLVQAAVISQRDQLTVDATTYAAAQAAWLAGIWSNSGVSLNNANSQILTYVHPSTAHFIGSGDVYYIDSITDHRPAGGGTLLSADDYYSRTTPGASGSTPSYSDPFFGTSGENQLARFASTAPGTAPLAGVWPLHPAALAFASPALNPPYVRWSFNLSIGGVDALGGHYQRTVVVNKWNVPGGFAFQ